jgi:cytosine deaminase
LVEEYDIIIRNARLRYHPIDKVYDIGISGGEIRKVSEGIPSKGIIEIDAEGRLVTEPFANPHIHMCKVYTFLMLGEAAVRQYQSSGMGGAMAAIELASKVKERYSEDWIYENAKKAALEALKHGTLYLRAFVDTDTKARLEGIKAMLRVRDELKHVMSIQVVAFPQDGILRDEGAEEYVRKALELGADVVGGIPWIELTEEDALTHIRKMLSLAKEFNKDVAMLTDDAGDPFLRTTEMLASEAIKTGWNGRVTACHARALSTYEKPSLLKLMRLSKKASMSFVMDPHTGPLHLPFKEMLKFGVNVALGQDDISDAYYPYGRNNMLEVAFLASHITWSMTLKDMDEFMDMITWRAMKAMNVSFCGVKEGCPADLLIHEGKSIYEVLWKHEPPKYVLSKGKIVAETESSTRLKI